MHSTTSHHRGAIFKITISHFYYRLLYGVILFKRKKAQFWHHTKIRLYQQP